MPMTAARSTTRHIATPHGPIALPAFLPDATQGVVRSIDSADLESCHVQAVVMNTFHLMQRPGSSTIQALGGLHRMTGWRRPIVTDSGGFQAYSLIRQNPRNGTLSDRGILFRPEGARRKVQLTPEKSVQLQVSYGADVVICLDDCTHAEDPEEIQEISVRRTIDWAIRGKRTFDRLMEEKRIEDAQRPLLFAVIQGGSSRDLRRRCAEALLEIGFDGFGYGGWPLDSEGSLLHDMLALTRELVPPEYPLHALGVGHPANVVACARMGYDLFDSAMPTRDARHGRLYIARADPVTTADEADWLSFLYIQDDKLIKRDAPVDPGCDCLCCSRYSAGYLHHLFKLGDATYLRLATIHNVRFMTRLMERLRSP
ncbi:MAG: tRNA guanosine(34) transglycosylase Tgt [Anaerolineae bacterium]